MASTTSSNSRARRPEETSSDNNFQVVPSTPAFNDVDTADDEAPLIHQRVEDNNNNNNIEDEDSEQQKPEPAPWNPAVVMVANLIKKLVTPVLRVVFAPKAQKTMIKSVTIVILVLWVVLTSVAAYLAFYRQYVPRTAHIEPIYFQYQHNVDEGPLAMVDLAQGQPYNPLRHEQTYDVFVRLHVPTSDINFDLGNFMVQTWLQTREGDTVVHSSRPAILRYQSKAQRVLHVFAKALPLLVGLTEESQVITVPIIEDFVEHKSKAVTQATIAISNPRLQIYDAEIRLMADFRGLRYFMYHRRIVTALGFIVMFIIIELICAAIAWRFFGQNLWNALHSAFEELQEEQRQQRLLQQQEKGQEEDNNQLDDVASATDNDHESE